MEFGVKSYDDEDFFDYFVNKADFFEIQAIQGKDYSYLKKYIDKNIYIVIHAEHHVFGVNHCNPKKEKLNLESIKFAQNLADFVNAKFIIVHPGRIVNEECSIEYFIKIFKKINDKRIIIENLPLSLNKKYFTKASTPKEIKYLKKELNCDFCFDLNHASETCVNQEKDLEKISNEFLKLNPVHFHLCGEKNNAEISHINLRDSELDISFVKNILPENCSVTLEVSIDKFEVEKDLNFAREKLNHINL
jgi:hypothetical protein